MRYRLEYYAETGVWYNPFGQVIERRTDKRSKEFDAFSDEEAMLKAKALFYDEGERCFSKKLLRVEEEVVSGKVTELHLG